MPPIPIHKDAPIKPSGITPQTDAPSNDNDNPPPPTRTLPISNPATTTSSSDSNPPAPQPGARPTPTSRYIPTDSISNPPAPQPGQSAGGGGYTATHITTSTSVQAPPPQFSLPPPTDSQLAGRSTTTSTTASKPGPTTLSLGGANPATSPYQAHEQGQGQGQGQERRSLEHPPGYVQSQVPDHPSYGDEGGVTAGGVGGAAWNVLAKAGEALRKADEAAWRAVGNK